MAGAGKYRGLGTGGGVKLVKSLGRCRAGHVTVVEREIDALPTGVCKHGHELCEWSVKVQ